MSRIALDVALVVGLVLVNGIFAMSEMAVVSSRRARLQQRAEAGDAGARRALALAGEPTRFLSTVQVGITLVGILAGAFGGATLAEELGARLAAAGMAERYAEPVGLAAVVLGITYLSLVVGELVPKRIALNAPERIAAAVAGPMDALSRAAGPVVRVLSASTELLLRLLRVKRAEEPPVTEEEIAVLLEQGTAAGVFAEEEQELVERVFWLGDQRVGALMTPRRKVVWLDLDGDRDEMLARTARHRFTRYLVARGSLDQVAGMVDVKDLWAVGLRGGPVRLEEMLRQPLFVPESTRALPLLERFRETGVHLAVVVDEYGGVEGVVTLTDLLEEITGALEGAAPTEPVVRRGDGSLLVDGALGVDDFRDALGLPERRAEPREYRTVGGLVFASLGRIPRAGEGFAWEGWRVEVVDMDANRVDKVLATRLPDAEDAG